MLSASGMRPAQPRLVHPLVFAVVLLGCTSAPPQSGAAAADAHGDTTTALTELVVKVKDRSVILQWEEDEYLYHCLVLHQIRAGKKPADVTFCPTKIAGTTLTIGDLGKPGVDYGWTAVQDFTLGPATWTLRGMSTLGGVKKDVSSGSLRIGPHFNGACTSADAQTTGLIEWHKSPPVTLDVSVLLGTAARSEVAISTPGILVESVTGAGGTAPGATLQFKYTFTQTGMYTVEVNNTGGGAIVNCAVYVGADVPLAPVEIDGGIGLNAKPDDGQLATMRTKLLNLTNAERAKVGLAALVLADKLNEIAQFHSDDMSVRNFFGHDDPDGNGPGDRAAKFGYSGGIGENIASSMSVEGAHNGLYWSAAHRSNMLGKSWITVGFGIAKAANPSKNLLVTENFGDQ